MSNLDKETVKQQILSGMTIMELADHYGCSRTKITSFKQQNGLVGLSPNGKTKSDGGTKICNSCHTEFSLDNFYSNGLYKNGRKKYKPSCKSCNEQLRSKAHYSKINEILFEAGREFKCELCGYNKNLSALVFHHLDPSEKENSISSMKTHGIEAIRKEIKKCALLCANCHSEIHNPHLLFDRFFGGDLDSTDEQRGEENRVSERP